MATVLGHGDGSAIRIRHQSGQPHEGTLFIEHCVVTNNVSAAGTISVAVTPDSALPTVIIANSNIRNNYGDTVAGVRVYTGTVHVKETTFEENDGHPLEAVNADLFVSDSLFSGNNSRGFGAINFEGSNGGRTLYIWNTTIADNSAPWTAMQVRQGSLVSINNVFTGNISQSKGGALNISESNAMIANNVFAFNYANQDGGAIWTSNSKTSISNSIFWQNDSQGNKEFSHNPNRPDTVSIRHSIVQLPVPDFVLDAGSLIESDPHFIDQDGIDNIPGTSDDDFRLGLGSPAIDSGANNALFVDFFDLDSDGIQEEFWSTDFFGNVRDFDGGAGDALVDLGIHEYDSVPVGVGWNYRPESVPIPVGGLGVYPNPARDRVSLNWLLPATESVHINIFDMAGRRIKQYRFSGLSPNDRIDLDVSDLSQGVYLIHNSKDGKGYKLIITR